METCFNYTDRDVGFFSSDERRHINKVLKLKEKYPDAVRIIKMPEENDGCIYAELPSSWLKVSPPIKRDLTDEERQEIADRLKSYRSI